MLHKLVNVLGLELGVDFKLELVGRRVKVRVKVRAGLKVKVRVRLTVKGLKLR